MSGTLIRICEYYKIVIMFEDQSLMTNIARNNTQHSYLDNWHKSFSEELTLEVSQGHSAHQNSLIAMGEVGNIEFPFYSMGNVNSSNLFGLDELILFSFYYQNRNRYSRVLDLGANIGLHTLVLLKLGYAVTSYEPDPIHINQIKKVLKANNFTTDGIVEAAVSTVDGIENFVRVLGNTTGSHLEGAKSGTPYGGYEKFSVDTHNLKKVLEESYDLVKMDVEGHEAALITHLDYVHFESTDFLLEVGSEANANSIYKRVRELGLNLYSQKLNWNLVKNESDIPISYKEGSLFITASDEMHWNH